MKTANDPLIGDGIRNGFADAIGNTPLIRLAHLSAATGCEILGKAEFMNPGGSVKDRAAKWMIDDAERSGRLKPGGIVVEGTAGNTGIGLAHVCNARGYKLIITMPDNQSHEKFQILRTLGAEVLPIKAVPYSDPNHYQKAAARIAEQLPGAVWANQFDNVANRQAHIDSTGPEIWQQTQGSIDAFVCATGTGGTLGGVARYLKQQSTKVKTCLADPQGSSLFHWIRDGQLKANGPGSITEGIGIGRVTANLQDTPIDDAVHVNDMDTVSMVYELLRKEGLFLGSTSGVNVAAAVQVAQQLGPGHTIVTILCDSGHKYQSRLFNRSWIEEKGFAHAAGFHLSSFANEPELHRVLNHFRNRP
ncbi:MAG: cysteine synthase A [Steroidobacter sp.]